MKQTLVILGICVTIGSCRTENSKDFTIDLPNLETQIELPARPTHDTLLTWKRTSDYRCGDEHYIRVQNSNDEFGLEKEWVHDHQPKNIDQLTITYPYYNDCNEIPIEQQNLKKLIESEINSERGISNDFEVNSSDSVEIDNQKFAFVSYEQPDLKIPERTIRKMIYMTYLNNRLVEFEFASNIPDDSSFFKTTKNRFEKMKINTAANKK